MKIHALIAATGLAAACVAAAPALAADSYPARPITLVIPFPPGGATDVAGRVLAQGLTKQLGQNVIVENRAGAGTVIGASYVARSAPDGYTLLVSSGTTFTINPAVRGDLPYDPVKSFQPLGIVARTGLILLANPKVPVHDIPSFLAYVKDPAHPATPYGSFGSGTTANFVGEAFAAAAGIQLTHVPYKGSSPAMADLIGGQIPFSVDTVAAALPQIKSGKVKPVAVSSPRRSSFLPDVPTFADQGYPQIAMDTWLMVAAPRGIPDGVKSRLETALAAVVADPDARQSLQAQGFEVGFQDAAAGSALIAKELPQMHEIAQRAHIKVE
ncbi:Bug family tripartite tricarboxylate transporter substrate binding protein [Bordetella bronchialis]|uniref:ABC transporter substrate-binding protein n=1 Tax=Bordetella bronchialis TaxID=463025 RepID=A0A193FY11_9BORD|nr:tripartite tricarboxylate transporter substrate binding protein [Bordetella bronchialis]ANN67167.1 ABC transporter substrate-binding protein [Bordetella bronchialis]ANN72253.1 ABC transporter substrate-binding protein [Bordetella bronchialis]